MRRIKRRDATIGVAVTCDVTALLLEARYKLDEGSSRTIRRSFALFHFRRPLVTGDRAWPNPSALRWEYSKTNDPNVLTKDSVKILMFVPGSDFPRRLLVNSTILSGFFARL
jgi:hypothetical protein